MSGDTETLLRCTSVSGIIMTTLVIKSAIGSRGMYNYQNLIHRISNDRLCFFHLFMFYFILDCVLVRDCYHNKKICDKSIELRGLQNIYCSQFKCTATQLGSTSFAQQCFSLKHSMREMLLLKPLKQELDIGDTCEKGFNSKHRK